MVYLLEKRHNMINDPTEMGEGQSHTTKRLIMAKGVKKAKSILPS